jgi:hypothetical protein
MSTARHHRDARSKRTQFNAAVRVGTGGIALAVLMLFGDSLLAQVAGVQTSGAGAAENGVTRDIDAELAAQIYATKATDNHAHPVLPPPKDKTDRDFDALPVDNMEPATDVVAWRADNPELPAAWKALWNFDVPAGFQGPLAAEGMKRLQAAREVVKTREGLHYDEWVLDQANIGVMVANRVLMGAGVQEPRFRWVPYADALLFPFDTSALAAQSPDKRLFFPLEDRLRTRYLGAVGLKAVPATLHEYLERVVTPTLEKQRAGGAIAEKFELAYLRSFAFSDPTEQEAAAVYGKWVGKTAPDSAEYKTLQDFLFRYIAMECGRLGMAVHLHTLAGGGGYFGIAGANPLLLEPLFNDPRMRHTNFVLLHGGWPFVREAGALLQKPNVYLDLSQQSLTFSPRTLATWLREWLETYPGKVLFGTDGYALSDAAGWEETTWIANRNGREALALALTGMVKDGEISRGRAGAIADEVLRGTAGALYATKPYSTP